MLYHGAMKLTKYQHACFTVELDGQLLLVDPGNLTTDLMQLEGLVAIVITHQHPDHCHPELIDSLGDGVKIYADQSVVDSLGDRSTQAVAAGDTVEVGSFRLDFFGGQHATIHSSIPGISNLGVAINQTVYYPGDSFAPPADSVDVLMLPVAAPWMKLAEAIDYVNQVKPRLAIPTHDAILSESGQAIVDRVVTGSLDSEVEYRRIVGEYSL